MRFFDTVRMSFQGITVHKNRSLLTILGIIIGIMSVVAVMSIGESAENLIVGQIERFGPTNIFLLPGREPRGPNDAVGTLLNDSLKIKDFEDLQKKENVPQAKKVIPYTFGFVNAAYGGETYDGTLIGSTEYSRENWDLKVAEGRYYDNMDVETRARVVVLGSRVKDELFANENAVGEKINFKGQKFTVIGVLEKEGQGSFVDFNKAIVAPYTSVQENVLGVRYFSRIIIEAESIEAVPSVVKDVKTLIRNNHNIDDPSKDDFYVQTQEGLTNQVKTVTSILTVLLASVAAISLLVGGVGIMNIMLVSVTERTKEIGLRKALGATNGNVMTQFLFEALSLTLLGGILGVMFGVLLTLAGSWAAMRFANLDLPFIFSLNGLFLALGVSFGIGLGFGFFPAMKAARKDPIESLYHE